MVFHVLRNRSIMSAWNGDSPVLYVYNSDAAVSVPLILARY